MPQFIAEHVQKLWGTWNIKGLIILSFLQQSFLILSAQLRKRRGGKWIIMIPLWIAYLLADWVATFTIGLMLRAEGSDILAFWAPFLLLHLGGPDTITSFSLEDNEFWIRHLLGLILQVGSTIYVILQSLPDNQLWLPTLFVLIAGVIKYAERNRAFYLASFDHFGNNWAYLFSDNSLPPIPVQFKQAHHQRFVKVCGNYEPWSMVPAAALTFGTIKSLLVGPSMTKDGERMFCLFMRERDSHEMLRTIEIQLSLLYELLHTKLPVVDSLSGYICRTVNFGCILGALVSFSILLKKYYHNKLGEFDICLTYGLLIGALALELISIWLLMSSDWMMVRQYTDKKNEGCHLLGQQNYDKSRWSNSVPQLNIFVCRFKNKDGDYPNEFIDFLGTRFETIRRRIQCVSSKNFVEGQAWEFIFKTLQEKGIGVAGSEIFGKSRILTSHITNFAWTFNKFEHMDRLLIWHIATEICYQKGCPNNSPDGFDHREICKLISDYMFYLLVMEPSMTAIEPNNLKIVFEIKDSDEKWKWPSYWEKGFKDLAKLLEEEDENAYIDLDLLKEDVEKLPPDEMAKIPRFSRIAVARFLTKELLSQSSGCPWELMSSFWLEILCYAAIKCQPAVHARQVSRSGQLLTLVCLLINYLGLTPPSMTPRSLPSSLQWEPAIKALKAEVQAKKTRG